MLSRILKNLRLEAGLAMFELAICSVMLLTLVLGGFSVSLYMQKAYSVNSSVERFVYESAVKPFIANSGGANTVSLNDTELKDYTDTLISSLSADIRSRIDDAALRAGTQGYYVEAAYAKVDVDSSTGSSTNWSVQYRNSQGGLQVPADLLSSTDLDAQFEYQYHHNQSLSHPTANLGLASGPQYLNSAVLIGVRAFISMKGAFTGEMYESLGGEPYIYSTKVVALRGDVKYE